MEKLIKGKSKKVISHENLFKNNISNQEIYDFLEYNHIDYQKAMQYYADLKIYTENPDKYELLYQNNEIILSRKIFEKNPGISYLDTIIFDENKNLRNINYKDNNSKALIIKKFLDNPQKGIYLCSNNGIGKTTLLIALSNSYFQKTKEKTLFVFWPDFIEKTKRFSENNYVYINKVKYAARLIIDDLGNESISAWSRDDILHSIIAYRLERKLPTFITSNFSQDNLYGMYTLKKTDSKKAKSIIEKIMTLAEFNYLDGENLRNSKEY